MLTLRFARRQDQAEILNFINTHWRLGHIFARWEALFVWQHHDGDAINFVLAEWKARLVGILGFIPHKRFDPVLPFDVISTALWSASDAAPPGTGVRMIRFLADEKKPDLAIAIGLTEKAAQLKRALGYRVEPMSHFFLPNPFAGRAIAQNLPEPKRGGATELGDFGGSLSSWRDYQPPKSETYLQNRYTNHPAYHYDFVRGVDPDKPFVLVVRRISAKGSAMARIVDFFGDPSSLPTAIRPLKELMETFNLEYVDFVHYGFPQAVLERCGFLDRDDFPNCILPGHFEPFEPRNVFLSCAFKSFQRTMPTVCLVRGDGDQDRPNQIPGESSF